MINTTSKSSLKITAMDVQISIFHNEKNDYISLTDIAKYKDSQRSDYIIQNWMRTRSAIEFLGLWEKINNPDFNSIDFEGFKNEAGSNSFSLTPKRWIETTNALGLVNRSGRYYGGTFAHKDIAFEFASWISPEFKLYLIREFQRLKEEESKKLSSNWDIKRILSKINYKIHTDAISQHLVIPQRISKLEANIIFASEADLLNKALFGLTAQEWKKKNPDLEGNIRDYPNVAQLICLTNLESFNAELIRQKINSSQRLIRLNEIAIIQLKSLVENKTIDKLEN